MIDNLIWQNRIIESGYDSPENLAQHFNSLNWRGHPESQREALEEALDSIGILQRVLVNRTTGRLIDGHLRVELAILKGQPFIPVDYVELSEDEEALALATLDAITEQAQPIPEKLNALLERTRALTADKPGLAGMLEQLKARAGVNGQDNAGKDVEPQIDKAEELRVKWGVETGQVWELGQHRIVCGDCTDKAVVEAVMRGERANMVFTDPPYNVDYGSNQAPIWGKSVKPIANDNMSNIDWEKFLNNWLSMLFFVIDNAVIYICMSAKEWTTTRTAFKNNGRHWSSDIIWVKNSLIPGRKNYHSRYEALLYGWVEGKSHYWCGDTTQDDVWEIKRNSINELHPTQKPVELVERALKNSSQTNDIVYEPFSGSGTTLIACENLNRRCRAIELDPGYVAVALQRWADLTGQQPRLITG